MTREGLPFDWQKTVWDSLANALKGQRFPHALLLEGERHIGKTLFTRAFAKLVLCKNRKDNLACGACRSCSMISAGTHPDRLELESGENHVSIKVDDVRLLSTFSQRSSHSGAARIAIIPEAHRMNSSASNALLKTLEEPQDQVYIILTSSEFGRLSATVRSRVQRIKMRSPSLKETTDFLSDELEEEGVLEFLKLSRGKPFIDGPEFSRQELSHYRDFQRCVLGTLFIKKSSYELQKCAFKLKPHSAIDEFFLIASEILKRNFIEQEGDIEKPCVSKEDISNIRSKQNSALEKAEFSENLATFISFVESAQKVIKSSSNPNPQLLLDSLIWRWERLGSSLETRNKH